MSKEITVTAEPRETRGKNEARRLRVKGLAPGVVYGGNGPAVAVAVNPKELTKILHSRTGHNTIFTLIGAGRGRHAGHDRRLAVRSGSRRHAACRSEAHRPVQAHSSEGSGSNDRRAPGRQASGRLARSHHARSGNRVSAERDSGIFYGGRDPVDDRPEPSIQRYRAERLHDSWSVLPIRSWPTSSP